VDHAGPRGQRVLRGVGPAAPCRGDALYAAGRILEEYACHPETTAAPASDQPAGPESAGELHRLRIRVGEGLIEASRRRHGINDRNTYWTLTDLGRAYLINLRGLRRVPRTHVVDSTE
jgi:hypothetical protein